MGTGEWLRRERKKEKETDRYNTLTDKNCGTHQGGSRRPSPAMEASRRPSSKPPPLDSHLRLLDFFVSFSFLLFLSSSRGPSSSRSARRRRVLGPQQAEEGGGGGAVHKLRVSPSRRRRAVVYMTLSADFLDDEFRLKFA